jgi:hypothetical protein
VVNSCIFYPYEKEVSHRWVEIRWAGSDSRGSWRKLPVNLCAPSPFPRPCAPHCPHWTGAEQTDSDEVLKWVFIKTFLFFFNLMSEKFWYQLS